MSASIDERVVQMKFDNGQFESGTKQTLSTLDKLKQGLNLDDSTRSLSSLQGVADRFHLAGIADNVDQIAGKFTALGVAGVTALANIANRAVNAGVTLVKSLTVDPINSGLDEYNTNLNSVQTILANTQSSGATLSDVNGALNELNLYSDKTIYNFGEMARNIGTFTAAGVGLKPATAAIKGIANLAALSGSNSQQASTAMYQLSQAISSGKVGLQDWNSVVNAGMGGTVFQRALSQTAVKMGTLQESAVKLSGPMKNVKIDGQSFRDSISAKNGQPSWLSSDVLTKTLQQFTGDMTDAQLKTEGFTKAQIKSIQAQAKTAQEAATVVKTLPQLIGTLQESAQSGWSQSFTYIFGDFEQAKELFTGVNRVIGNLISSGSNARNAVLKGWEANGGRAAAITAVAQAFGAVMNVVKAMQKAFRSIFPATTSQQLVDITVAISRFAQILNNFTRKEGPNIQRTFAGVFAVLDIGRMIVVEVIKTLFSLFGQVGNGSGSFLEITAKIGDFLVSLRNAIKEGQGITTFFSGLGAVIRVPIAFITALVGALGDLAHGVDPGKAVDGITKKMQPLTVASKVIAAVWQKFGENFTNIVKTVAPAIVFIGNLFGAIGQKITDSLTTVNYDKILSGVNTGLFAALVIIIKKFLSSGSIFKVDVGGGIFKSLKEGLEGVSGSMQAMQQNLRANVLIKIALALAILTASVVALSLIDPVALAKATGALTVMFTQLGVAMALFSKISIGPKMLALPTLATSMILLAIAIAILAGAVKTLSEIDTEGLIKGLGAVMVLLGSLAGTAALMKKTAVNLIPAGLGMIAIAIAVKILADAVGVLGSMDLVQLGTGLGAVAVILATIAGFTKIIGNPTKLVAAGAGMILIGLALKIMVGAIAKLGSLDPAQLGLGLGAMAVALAVIAGAVAILPGASLILTGAGLVIVAAALVILASALTTMGGMSIDQIGKALGVLAASLIILAASLILMEGSLPGALALIVAAAALAILAPVLQQMGNMDIEAIGKALGLLAASLIIIAGSLILMTASLPGAAALLVAAAALAILAPVLSILGNMTWDEIGRGLVVLAGALAIIGVAGLLLTPVIPTLLGLGAAITLLGLGAALAGLGVLAFAVGLTALGVAGAAGAAGLTVALSAVLGLIPLALQKLGEGIVALAGVIEAGAPAIVDAIVAVVLSLLDAVDKIAPQLIDTVISLVVDLANALSQGVPALYRAGYKLIIGVLNAVSNNIGKVITAGTNVIIAFIQGISKNLLRIVKAGADLIVRFVEGLADSVDKNADRMGRAGGKLAAAIIRGMVKGIAGGLDEVVKAATGIGGAALDAIKTILGIASPSKEFRKVGEFATEGFIIGLTGNKDEVKKAFDDMSDQLKSFIEKATTDIDDYKDKLLDMQTTQKDDIKAVAEQKKVLAQAELDRKNGTDVKEEQSKLEDLTKARNKDTREIRNAHDAVKEAEAKASSGKTAAARKTAEKQAVSAKQKIKDLTDKREKDTAAIVKQEEVLKQARKDRKSGVEVSDEQDKLNKLRRTQAKNLKELGSTQDALKAAQDELPKAQSAYDELTKSLAGQEAQLEDLATSHDDYKQKIEDQTKVLEDATKTRDDYNNSIKESFSALSDISQDTQIDDYFTKLEDQITNVNEFSTKLQALRSQGLGDTAYKKLLSEGTDALPFIDQLLSQGQNGIQDFNGLISQLDSAAGSLGSSASNQLYQAGVDTAQGLLDGLKSKQSEIETQMKVIGTAMVDAIKNQLGIRSPSRVFAQLGVYSAQGLAQGLTQTSGTVESAADTVANNALTTLRNTLSNVGDSLFDMNSQPTIRPVLDLTAVQRDAGLIGGMLSGGGLGVTSSYSSASNASNGYDANQAQMIAVKSDVASSNGAVFNQYNSSPKTLSNAEIYRQTTNLFSKVQKGD